MKDTSAAVLEGEREGDDIADGMVSPDLGRNVSGAGTDLCSTFGDCEGVRALSNIAETFLTETADCGSNLSGPGNLVVDNPNPTTPLLLGDGDLVGVFSILGGDWASSKNLDILLMSSFRGVDGEGVDSTFLSSVNVVLSAILFGEPDVTLNLGDSAKAIFDPEDGDSCSAAFFDESTREMTSSLCDFASTAAGAVDSSGETTREGGEGCGGLAGPGAGFGEAIGGGDGVLVRSTSLTGNSSFGGSEVLTATESLAPTGAAEDLADDTGAFLLGPLARFLVMCVS